MKLEKLSKALEHLKQACNTLTSRKHFNCGWCGESILPEDGGEVGCISPCGLAYYAPRLHHACSKLHRLYTKWYGLDNEIHNGHIKRSRRNLARVKELADAYKAEYSQWYLWYLGTFGRDPQEKD